MLASIALHGDVLIKLITVLIPIAVHIGDRLLGGLWAKFRRTLVVLAVLSSLVFVFYTFFQAPKVNEVLFILFLIFWGGAVYSLIVELLRAGLGVYWSGSGAQKSNKWIRRFEYPVLVLTILGLIVTINRLPVIDKPMPNLDLIGPIILMTAATVKFAKTRAEIGEWQNLTETSWKTIW